MKLKRMWIPFALLILLALPVRIYQTMFMQGSIALLGVELSSYGVTLALLVLTGLFVLCFIIMSARAKNANNSFLLTKNIAAGIFALLTGVLLLCDSASRIITEFSGGTTPGDVAITIISVFAGIVFLLFAIEAFSGRDISKKLPVLMLLPTVWACARLVHTFFLYTNIASISENMFDIISLIFLLLFLFLQAKLQAGLSRVSSAKKAMVFGLPAVVLLLMYSLPNLLTAFTQENTGFLTLLPFAVDAALALYIFSYLIGLTSALSKAERLADEGDAMPSARTEEFDSPKVLPMGEASPAVGSYSDEHVVDEILNHYDVANGAEPKRKPPIPMTPEIKQQSTLSQIDKLIDEICAEEDAISPKDGEK